MVDKNEPFLPVKLMLLSSLAPSSSAIDITVTNITSRSFTLHWQPPSHADRNGVIRGYTITSTGESSDEVTVYTVGRNVTTLEFQDLHPAYTYGLEVAAVTTRQGPFSDRMSVTMAEDGEKQLVCTCIAVV